MFYSHSHLNLNKIKKLLWTFIDYRCRLSFSLFYTKKRNSIVHFRFMWSSWSDKIAWLVHLVWNWIAFVSWRKLKSIRVCTRYWNASEEEIMWDPHGNSLFKQKTINESKCDHHTLCARWHCWWCLFFCITPINFSIKTASTALVDDVNCECVCVWNSKKRIKRERDHIEWLVQVTSFLAKKISTLSECSYSLVRNEFFERFRLVYVISRSILINIYLH